VQQAAAGLHHKPQVGSQHLFRSALQGPGGQGPIRGKRARVPEQRAHLAHRKAQNVGIGAPQVGCDRACCLGVLQAAREAAAGVQVDGSTQQLQRDPGVLEVQRVAFAELAAALARELCGCGGGSAMSGVRCGTQ
jgi:hypothetical protein